MGSPITQPAPQSPPPQSPAPQSPAPQSIDQRASPVGLRAVATLEAVKGILVIILLILLLAVHSRLEDYAEDLLFYLHIDFDHHFAQRFLRGASRLSDSPLWTISIGATVYASVRFIEAWGLWNRRVWAEWFALLSGAIYLPFELMKVLERATWEHVAVLASNIVIVLYMLVIRIRGSKAKAAEIS
jgi:uncharacterized membrane protein (DUF2068 family)